MYGMVTSSGIADLSSARTVSLNCAQLIFAYAACQSIIWLWSEEFMEMHFGV